MPNKLQIAPNKPLFVRLADPQDASQYDFEIHQGNYRTTDGQILTLPRPAVILLNGLEPKPGEEIVIQQHWTGRASDSREWTVALSTQSELARAEAEDSQDLTPQLEASIRQAEERKTSTATPTPIRTPAKREPKQENTQPRLFDQRGTGTNGPAPAAAPLSIPLPAVAIGKPTKPGQIPANVATREILQFIQSDPNTANWSDQARQDLLSTILIAEYRQGRIGLWERA